MDVVVAAMHGVAAKSKGEIREAISDLAATMLAAQGRDGLEDFPVRHHFAPGSYGREITLPEGTVIVGKIHRHAHLNVLSAGRVLVLTERGVEELVAPCTFVSPEGTRRVVYTLENAVWTTMHVTNSTDLDEIEREIIAEAYSDIEIDGSKEIV